MALTSRQYRETLVQSGLVSEKDFIAAEKTAKNEGVPLESALVMLGVYSDEQIGKLMADAFDLTFVNMNRITIDPKAAAIIPEVVAKRQGIFAYGWEKEQLRAVVSDPSNLELVGFIEKKTGHPVLISYTTPNLLQDALGSFVENSIGHISTLVETFKEQHKAKKAARGDDEAVAVEVVDLLMNYAYANGASDVHMEPQENTALLRYRIDGVLHDIVELPILLYEKVVSRIKIMSHLRTDEHFGAQDGKFRQPIDKEKIDVRVSILPVVGGEKVVMRLLSDKGRAFTLESLGMQPKDLEKVEKAAAKPYGMILSTGPTGSGKTTSLYAVLKILNSREVNIQTIEDPVEYDVEGVNQIQVNERTNLTFAEGLRAIVRQDPDIIMVGEIRDTETAGIAVNAAMTGHLVLSTLHTNDAATALPRLSDMKVEPFLIASSVNIIIAQRLVRKICQSCIASEEVSLTPFRKQIPEEYVKKYFGEKTDLRLYKGKGCAVCHQSGFIGRIGIFEVIEISDPIRDMIVKETDAATIKKKAIEEGMTTMFEDGIRKAISGETTIEEVLRVVSV